MTSHAPKHPNSKPLFRELIAATLPAYLFPFATSFPGGLITKNPELLTASYTTIPIPGALATACVVLVARAIERGRRHDEAVVRPWQAALLGLCVCGTAGVLVVGLLVWLNILASHAWGYACPSAAIGGGVSAFVWARRRARRANEPQARTQRSREHAQPLAQREVR